MLRSFVSAVAIVTILILPFMVFAAKLRSVVLDSSYDHDRYKTIVLDAAGRQNYVKRFRAYISVFDGEDDDDGDGISDHLAVPHFVAYEMKRFEGNLKKGPDRPSEWISDKQLRKKRIAPADASYAYSRAFRSAHENWYVRGHLAMKQHAWRLGAHADWNTHTVVNAVPQRQEFNAGIWLDLEKITAKWADEYGAVWIITGPIFEPQKHFPDSWLGELHKGEIAVAIPDKLFKIVIKESGDPLRPDVLAFVFPQDANKSSSYDHVPFIRSVDFVERKTGIDFLTILPDEIEAEIEKQRAEALWPFE